MALPRGTLSHADSGRRRIHEQAQCNSSHRCRRRREVWGAYRLLLLAVQCCSELSVQWSSSGRDAATAAAAAAAAVCAAVGCAELRRPAQAQSTHSQLSYTSANVDQIGGQRKHSSICTAPAPAASQLRHPHFPLPTLSPFSLPLSSVLHPRACCPAELSVVCCQAVEEHGFASRASALVSSAASHVVFSPLQDSPVEALTIRVPCHCRSTYRCSSLSSCTRLLCPSSRHGQCACEHT